MYRGISVGPYVLQSLLMALERWLLEYAKEYARATGCDILVDILHRSESAALSAVVASVATAHPHESVEALLVLLSAPDYIAFESQSCGERASDISNIGNIPSAPKRH